MIEVLVKQPPSELAFAAARLFISEISVFREVYSGPEDYLHSHSDDDDTLYALTETGSGLLAASMVEHHASEYHGALTYTGVSAIAVESSVRNQGNFRTLIHYIAEQAISHGDSSLILTPADGSLEAYRHLGFAMNTYDDMEATPQAVLAH